MKKIEKAIKDSAIEFERALRKSKEENYLLRLFITGTTPRSIRAIDNIKTICEENLKGRYTLEVVNLYQQPGMAQSEQIFAAPTLIKKLPLPLRRIIGDLSDQEKVLAGLDIKKDPK